jgi:transcriptional regulator of arginine metabolism
MEQDKDTRHAKILDLVRSKRIRTQSQMVDELEKAGFEVNQSSVSRDLEELNVLKRKGVYALPPARIPGPVRGLLNLKTAGDALIVASCESGWASAVTAEIDKVGIPQIVGTIAGEDTVFIAVDGKRSQGSVIKALEQIFV